MWSRKHQDNETIAKLKSNLPLSHEDVEILEQILWSNPGAEQEYKEEYRRRTWKKRITIHNI